MPKLDTYISVGFCSGYGDGDYRVSCAVEDMSRKQLDELMLAMFHAQRTAWDMWRRAQHQEMSEQANTGGDRRPAPDHSEWNVALEAAANYCIPYLDDDSLDRQAKLDQWNAAIEAAQQAKE